MKKCYYYVYKVTNRKNGHFYIGRKKHHDPRNDPYMGSGKLIKRAIEKYGKESFEKEIIDVFEKLDEAVHLEKELVTKVEVSDPNCYNMHSGGYGGFDHINKDEPSQRKNLIALREKLASGEITCGGIDHWTEESYRKHAESSRATLERLRKEYGSTWNMMSDEKREEVRKNRSIRANETIKKYNPAKGKVWCVKKDAENYNDRKLYFPSEMPDAWISCKEHREKVKRENNIKSWYNDGERNYVLHHYDEKTKYLKRGRLL